jgi:phage host-nuclease inhibitor protein Gam
MALINTALLVQNAAVISDYAQRANQVQQDPAVRKSCAEARDDVLQAGRSVAKAWVEVRVAWRRSGPSGRLAVVG